MAISEPGDPPAASRVEPGSASGKVEIIVGAQRLLTINTGSSSLKAALYRLWEDTTETPEIRAEASRIGNLHERLGEASEAREAFSLAAQTLRMLAQKIADEELRERFLSAPQVRRVLGHTN